jgi:hypothetical protein
MSLMRLMGDIDNGESVSIEAISFVQFLPFRVSNSEKGEIA